MKRIAVTAGVVFGVLAIIAWQAWQLSPWPSALLVRHVFDQGAAAASAKLLPHVPAGIEERRDIAYRADDSDALLDLYRPADAGATKVPAVVWIHGGAFISGDKADVANYIKVIAARGYATVSVGYSIAPGKQYPTPVHQANDAIGWLVANAESLGIDPQRIALAGDSAGAQIAGQLANIITSPAYAEQMGLAPGIPATSLKAALLHCGAFDASSLNLDGAFGGFLRTVMWSYFGQKDFLSDPRLREFSVAANMTPAFPRAFISAGNADPLEPQSKFLAETAASLGVPVETLFFPDEQTPELHHEYQFDLDTDAGKLALERSVSFLARHLGTTAENSSP